MKTTSARPTHEPSPAQTHGKSSGFNWSFIGFIALGFTAIVASHWLSGVTLKLAREHSVLPEPALAAIAFLGFIIAFWVFHESHHNRRPGIPTAAFGVAVLVSGQWFALSMEGVIDHALEANPAIRHPTLVFAAASLLLYLGAGTWFAKKSPGFSRFVDLTPKSSAKQPDTSKGKPQPPIKEDEKEDESTRRNDGPGPRCLILFVSALSNGLSFKRDGDGPDSPFVFTRRLGDSNLNVQVAAAGSGTPQSKILPDIQKLNAINPCNWQQLLRIIDFKQQPEEVWLIGSSDEKPPGKPGSFRDCHICGAWLARYLPASSKVRVHSKGINFENYTEVMETINGLIAENLRRFDRSDIWIDVTGGQKVTSIAAAITTVNNPMTFCYISTNPPGPRLTYDIIYDQPHIHGGIPEGSVSSTPTKDREDQG